MIAATNASATERSCARAHAHRRRPLRAAGPRCGFVDSRAAARDNPPVSRPAQTSFAARLRRMRSKRNEDWWSIVFGGPIATVLTAAVADTPWVTPNRLTWLAFVTKLVAAACIVLGAAGGPHHFMPHDVIAIVCMQANTVLDCMDGTLARHRGMSSVYGAFLDKVTDALGMLAVMSAFGWRVLHDTGDAAAMVVCLAAVMLWTARIYAYWVVAFFERDRGVPNATARAETRADLGELSFRQRLAYYLRSSWRILAFSEADAFFWLALALATGWLRPVAYVYGIGLAAGSLWILFRRLVRAAQIDAWLRSKV